MKHFKLILLALAVFFTSCNCDDGSPDDFDLTHYYEPHITVTHDTSDPTKHFYSVMIVVEKDKKVYEKRDNASNGVYDITFSFKMNPGSTLLQEIKSYPLNAKYELRLYKYPIADINDKALYDGSQFTAVVYDPPADHPHDHPQTLHQGTIHRPDVGDGGGGGGGVQ